jgi:hypothetical protein
MYNHLLYFGYWIVNSTLFFLASRVVPDNIIKLGSWRFSSIESSLYAGFILTFLIWVFWDFGLARRFSFNKKFFTFAFFLIANIFSIFAISHFKYFTGFEVNSYAWIFFLALIATIAQRLTRMVIIKRRSFMELM